MFLKLVSSVAQEINDSFLFHLFYTLGFPVLHHLLELSQTHVH